MNADSLHRLKKLQCHFKNHIQWLANQVQNNMKSHRKMTTKSTNLCHSSKSQEGQSLYMFLLVLQANPGHLRPAVGAFFSHSLILTISQKQQKYREVWVLKICVHPELIETENCSSLEVFALISRQSGSKTGLAVITGIIHFNHQAQKTIDCVLFTPYSVILKMLRLSQPTENDAQSQVLQPEFVYYKPKNSICLKAGRSCKY